METRHLLDIVLTDDNTLLGGTSHSGETLQEFLEETNINVNTPLDKVNAALKECGIGPIDTTKVRFTLYNKIGNSVVGKSEGHHTYEAAEYFARHNGYHKPKKDMPKNYWNYEIKATIKKSIEL